MRIVEDLPLDSSRVIEYNDGIVKKEMNRWDVRVRLPENILYKGKYISELIEAHHLESFLESEEEEEEDDDEDS